ncbi:MAG: FAD-binding oxidoreductase [Bryobacteraceae bacterium]|nr:FAD-binding oxidoreductase [Bryobacteraceae bacterium]MDW8378579.1 FAD-binding oxidoreductase [Bryobacterales bacterium]
MLAHQIPHQARLLDVKEIAPEIRHFWFDIPDLETFEFIPGQFVSLSQTLNGKKVTRAYSICSLPKANTFEIVLNLVHEGIFSPYLFSLKPGDQLEMKGPHGMFVLRKPVNHSIFVATGTGIAPFRPMLQYVLPRDREHEFVLVFGVRYDHSFMFKREFEEMERQYPNFKFIPTVTRPSPEWRGNVGRVQQYVFDHIGARRDFDVYICGLKEMVNDVRDRCIKELGFDKKQVVYERYD